VVQRSDATTGRIETHSLRNLRIKNDSSRRVVSHGLPDPEQNITTTNTKQTTNKCPSECASQPVQAQRPPLRLHLRLSHLSLSWCELDVVGQVVQAPDLTDGLPVRFSFVLDGVVKHPTQTPYGFNVLVLNGSHCYAVCSQLPNKQPQP